ncbi:MAG: hypothetical protein AAGA84_00460 [Pseudomonadota bacterium]
MNIDQRLRNDAQNIQPVHSDTDAHALQQRLRVTPQDMPTRSRAQLWLPGGLIAASVLMALLWTQQSDTSIEQPDEAGLLRTQTNVDDALRPLLEVSEAKALEQEWAALQADVQRVRDDVQATLPVTLAITR